MPTLVSLLDTSKTLYPEQWALSLVAKPRGKNPEHAFIIVEGLSAQGEQCIYRRYDFVFAEQPTHGLQTVPGLVKHKELVKPLEHFSEAERETLFWAYLMNDSTGQEGCKGATWIITATQAEKLHAAVLADQRLATPLLYNLAGDRSILGPSSSQAPGHNCFTWACAKLLALDDPAIKTDARLSVRLSDFLAARTTRHLALPATEPEPVSGNLSCRLM